MSENKAQEVSLDDLETEVDTPEKSFRFARLPDWKFLGWQFTFFFGKMPDPSIPLAIQLGWRVLAIGIFKLKELPAEGSEIKSENIHGGLIQAQIWLPLDGFGKL